MDYHLGEVVLKASFYKYSLAIPTIGYNPYTFLLCGTKLKFNGLHPYCLEFGKKMALEF
jgi:hypothetical protein